MSEQEHCGCRDSLTATKKIYAASKAEILLSLREEVLLSMQRLQRASPNEAGLTASTHSLGAAFRDVRPPFPSWQDRNAV